MGAPGSGKGTCAVELKSFYGIPHISTGEMFRKAIQDKTPLGVLAQQLIDKGHFVPDDITNQLVKERLSQDDCKKGFILDGYPRNLQQAEALSEILKELNLELDAAIDLEIEDQVVVDRIVNRRLCSNCGKSYHIKFNPSKKENICDDCGSNLVIREDDNEESVKGRLKTYYEHTYPLINYYKEQQKLINIDATQDIESIAKNIDDILGGIQ
jgi:adenylate kinase